MRTMLQGQFSGALIHQLDRLFRHGTAAGLSEGELLDRFVAANDESAFEVLIARHGPMVLGVCRRLLRDPNDVDDAFQATFLVLVRKAGTLRRRDLLGNWLYGVAHKVATRSRVLAAKRTARVPHGQDAIDGLDAGREGSIALSDQPDPPADEPCPWVHEEVRLLPEKYRSLVLLCYFEGLTHEQAAERLGCPIGTVKGRLSRAREILRKRLVRRGVTVSSAAIGSALADVTLRAAVPEALKSATLGAVRAAGSSSSTVLPIATLADGVVQAMISAKLKSIALVLLVLSALTTGLVISSAQSVNTTAKSQEPSRAAVEKAAATKAVAGLPGTGGAPQPAPDSAPVGGAASFNSPVGGAGGGRIPDGPYVGGGSNEAEVEFQSRMAIAQLAAALDTVKSPQNEGMLKALDEPVTMAFAQPTPLDDVLKYIKKATTGRPGMKPLPIYVDPKGLADVNTTLNSLVTLDLDGVPLKTTLRLMLKQLKLAYCVRDGVLIISSVQGIREELAEEAREQLGSGNAKFDASMLNQMGLLNGGGMM